MCQQAGGQCGPGGTAGGERGATAAHVQVQGDIRRRVLVDRERSARVLDCKFGRGKAASRAGLIHCRLQGESRPSLICPQLFGHVQWGAPRDRREDGRRTEKVGHANLVLAQLRQLLQNLARHDMAAALVGRQPHNLLLPAPGVSGTRVTMRQPLGS